MAPEVNVLLKKVDKREAFKVEPYVLPHLSTRVMDSPGKNVL